jgi:hypothetical protein
MRLMAVRQLAGLNKSELAGMLIEELGPLLGKVITCGGAQADRPEPDSAPPILDREGSASFR